MKLYATLPGPRGVMPGVVAVRRGKKTTGFGPLY